MKLLSAFTLIFTLFVSSIAFPQATPVYLQTPAVNLDKLVAGKDYLKGHILVYMKDEHTSADNDRIVSLMNTLGKPSVYLNRPTLVYEVKLKPGISVKKAVLKMSKDPAVKESKPEFAD